jgi:5-methylcytosine-specific restriction endonuclease McrA
MEGILSYNTTHFNTKKIKGECESCGQHMGEEIHHLQHQKHADKNNYIGSFHKNHPANLISVCSDCHNKFHKTDIEHKKVKTTSGYKISEINGDT